MNRREWFRQTMWGAAGAAAASQPTAGAREFPADYDDSKTLAAADWKPAFLDEHQDQTLVAFADLIIPGSDTPGAKDARVNRFIDRILAAETREVQRGFLNSLAFLDGEAFRRYRAPFAGLQPEQQGDVLTFMAYPHTLVTWQDNQQGGYTGYEHFANLKDWVSKAFYSSEAGMRALGYDGPPHGEFTGCPHREGHH